MANIDLPPLNSEFLLDFLPRWIQALRFGDYIQGGGQLHRINTYSKEEFFCCLGVACDIIDQSWWQRDPEETGEDTGTRIIDVGARSYPLSGNITTILENELTDELEKKELYWLADLLASPYFNFPLFKDFCGLDRSSKKDADLQTIETCLIDMNDIDGMPFEDIADALECLVIDLKEIAGS